MNEAIDNTIKCDSCVNKHNITICRACRNYDIGNKGFPDLYSDENAKADNLHLKDGSYFSISENDCLVNLTLKVLKENFHADTNEIVIPMTYNQANIIQIHIYRIFKKWRENNKNLETQTTEMQLNNNKGGSIITH